MTEIEKSRCWASDVTEPTWYWFLNNGPHGEGFTWSQTKSMPPGYVSVEHLEKNVRESSEADPTFIQRVKEVVTSAFEFSDADTLIRAIQVGSVIGSEIELEAISALTTHPDELVSKNAKAGAFYLKQRLKR